MQGGKGDASSILNAANAELRFEIKEVSVLCSVFNYKYIRNHYVLKVKDWYVMYTPKGLNTLGDIVVSAVTLVITT